MGYEMFYIYLILMVVSVAMQSGAKTSGPPMEAGKLETPTAEEGSSIPVIFGTVIIKRSNVVWYGDSLTTEIKSGGGGKK